MKKKVKFLIIILILILLIFILKSTYSKYVGEAEGDVQATIGQWIIKVNETDITVLPEIEGEEQVRSVQFQMTKNDFIWKDDKNIYGSNLEKNKAAPGMNGEFYIKIDPAQTDTSFKYEIKLDLKSLKETNLKLEDVYLADGKTLEYKLDEENDIVTINRIKPLSEIKDEAKCIDNVTVKINWPFGNSDSPYDKINEMDTILGMNAFRENDLEIPVTVKAIQYTGE